MSNERNAPCLCGSGKKYKKCCLNKNSSIALNIISEDLKQKLDCPCWFHGSECNFTSWVIPPPPKPRDHFLEPHSGIFFTSNIDFAKGAGKNIARVILSSKAKILDTTANYEASEKLRLEIMKNKIAAMTLNVNHDYWHNGWKTGDVLRLVYASHYLDKHMEKMIFKLSNDTGLSIEDATRVIQHNTSRSLIELICTSAKNLGYDAIYGHEIDRHSVKGKVIAQPWLAVLSNGTVTDPEWIF